ncbi:spore germination protein [Bacillus paralicheniformis]|jgi:spore germination protein|uniref:spore germination protein n=1 Tax=Bacillus TaxID=1386 RepID=UPI00034247C7|nr:MULTISPECIES: spore germination protein [Bacillus]KJD53337.1 spore gernimation protein [Bacillus amyloliquefaciens]KUL07876.1 spore germination protein [Bacillus licheniformis LMG 7559]KUL19037.1 spore germination protein [Bacillus licheniformis LMG 6934]AGN36609.1 spore germination protein [Bacillus paralicheniformis ATCC 9945a]AYQ16607.1 spore gernimation protein [Bacillus paralicheniformis]
MMVRHEERITTSQTAVIITNFLLGTGILTLPRTSVEEVGTPDVWITLVLGGLVALLAAVIMVKLNHQYPDKTFYEFSQDIIGKWIGSLISLLFASYLLAHSGFQVRSMLEIIRFFLLEGTPRWAIVMVFLWVGLYLIVGGLSSIARLFQIVLPITFILFLLVVFMSIGIFDVDNLRPVLGKGIGPVLKGIKVTALSFSGIEIILVLMPFMNQPRKAIHTVTIGIAIPLLFYMVTVVMVIGALSIDGVVSRTWPTIDLMRSFEIPGLIFERFESLLLVIWIMQLFSTFVISFYGAALGLAHLFKTNIRPMLFALLPVIYLMAMIPKNINNMFAFGDFIGNSGVYLGGLTPLVLLVISKIRRRKQGTDRG